VAVKIKLKRLGKIRAPYYRIVVADARTKRDGRAIEEIGKYHPKAEPSFIEVDSERAQHWLSVGAQPTDPVRKLLEITGDWQKFKGLPGTEGTLKTAVPKENRKEIFAAVVKETLEDGGSAPKGKARSGAGKEAESPARTGKASARDSSSGKAEKPAKAKADESGGDAKASTDEAKAKARDGGARDGGARGGAAKAAAADDTADAVAPAEASAEADAAAETADSESASGA